MKIIAALALFALLDTAHAQKDANLVHPHEILTVMRDGYTISALVTHVQGQASFKHGVALFPGHPGILQIQGGADGTPKFEQRGNFLIRTRRFWVDDDTVVLSIDAPSDQWRTFYQQFRETPRYGEDVGTLLREAARKYHVEDWTFVGTSEGSVSAFHAARMNPALATRLILTSSLFEPSRNGPGLLNVKLESIPEKTLWVHHVDDPCPYTPYRDAQSFAKRSGKPLVTVRGGGDYRGDRCEAFSQHGYRGVEREVVEAMRQWVKTGTAPSEVRR
jgi:pimeloyl-ACP methyl ester carboxylesterase